MRKPVIIIISLFSAIIVLSVIRVTLSTQLSTTGVELSDIQNQIQKYKKENSIIGEKLFTLTSLTRIASVSSELGFTEIASQVHLTSYFPIALKQ